MISGPNIDLVSFEERHLPKSREWFNNPDLAKLLDRASTISEDEHHLWFSSLSNRNDLFYLAIESRGDKRHLGNVWLADIDKRNRKAELRIVIGDSAATSRGIGSESISLLCDHAFSKMQLHRIYACVLDTNPRAKKAFEKAGFQVDGTLKDDRWTGDRFVDVYLLSKVSV